MDYAWIMHGLRMDYAWIMHRLFMDCASIVRSLRCGEALARPRVAFISPTDSLDFQGNAEVPGLYWLPWALSLGAPNSQNLVDPQN